MFIFFFFCIFPSAFFLHFTESIVLFFFLFIFQLFFHLQPAVLLSVSRFCSPLLQPRLPPCCDFAPLIFFSKTNLFFGVFLPFVWYYPSCLSVVGCCFVPTSPSTLNFCYIPPGVLLFLCCKLAVCCQEVVRIDRWSCNYCYTPLFENNQRPALQTTCIYLVVGGVTPDKKDWSRPSVFDIFWGKVKSVLLCHFRYTTHTPYHHPGVGAAGGEGSLERDIDVCTCVGTSVPRSGKNG